MGIGMNSLWAAFGCFAPYWARNKQYIDEHVREPFDYIVIDQERLERELTSNGIDHSTFSNIRRLTPAVYREGIDSEWIVKNDYPIRR
jgi:hypothetical protein